MNKKVRLVFWIIVCVIVLALIAACAISMVNKYSEGDTHPEVTFEITDYGIVKMELYPEYAPNTVANFIKLVESGYYNNKVIYGKDDICLYVGRDSSGEVIDPTLSTIGMYNEEDSSDYAYSIEGEFISNGFNQNTLRHETGIVTLLRNDYSSLSSSLTDESYNSGNAQFAIMMSDSSSTLNGVYAAFGRITAGLDILQNIFNDETNGDIVDTIAEAEGTTELVEEDEEENGEAITQFISMPVISSATVDTHGVDYGDPVVEEEFDYNSYIQNLYSQYYSAN